MCLYNRKRWCTSYHDILNSNGRSKGGCSYVLSYIGKWEAYSTLRWDLPPLCPHSIKQAQVKRGETKLIPPRKGRRLALRAGQGIGFSVYNLFKAANGDRAPYCTMLVVYSDLNLIRLCICNAACRGEDEYPEMGILIDVTRSRGGAPTHEERTR